MCIRDRDNTSSSSILNTPYFHKQLYSDFSNTTTNYGKYAGSAYLLLNSLPFKDLEDEFDFGNGKTRLFTVFKEIAASHYVPYHLILKWGSIYHRYKKYLTDGVDILSGITNSIDGALFYDGVTGNTTYNVGSNMNYTVHNVIGLHPYYESIFHQIVNGYSHFNILSGATDYNTKVTSGIINPVEQNVGDGSHYWTSFVDNSKDPTGNAWYTLLPSANTDVNYASKLNSRYANEQKNFKTLWCYDTEVVETNFSGKTFFNYNEYNRTYDSGITFFQAIEYIDEFFTGTIRNKDNQYSLELSLIHI